MPVSFNCWGTRSQTPTLTSHLTQTSLYDPSSEPPKKKPGLDKSEPSNFRSISNLTERLFQPIGKLTANARGPIVLVRGSHNWPVAADRKLIQLI